MKQLSASEERLLKNAVILAAQSFVFQALTKQYGIGIQLFKLCSKIGSGSTPKGGKAVYVSDGIPFVRSMNVRQYKFQEENLVRIPPEINEAMSGTCVVPGDVYLNITGASIGRSCCAPEKLCPANVSQHVCIIRPITELLDSCFLMYWLNDSATQEEINMIQKGATRQALTKRQIENFRVPGVPLSEQKEVAAFLESVRLGQDYREIKLPFHLQHIAPAIARIEELAAKVEEARGLRRQSAEEAEAIWESSLTTTFNITAQKYPNQKFEQVCEVVRGGSPRPAGSPTYYDGSIPFLKVGDLTKNETKYLNNYTATIKETGLSHTRHVQANTLMLTNSGATLGVPKICTFETTFNDGIQAFINFNQEISQEYLYYFLRSQTQWFREWAARGQGQPNLNTNMVKKMLFPLPPLPEQHRIVAYLDDLQSKVDALKRLQAETATELDALLPSILDKAFKGEL